MPSAEGRRGADPEAIGRRRRSPGSTSSRSPTSTASWCCPARRRPWRAASGRQERDRHLVHRPLWPRPGSRRPRCRPPSVLVTADDVTPRQAGPRAVPRPPPSGLGVDPSRCLVVEDAPAGWRRPAPPAASRLRCADHDPAERMHGRRVVEDLGSVSAGRGSRSLDQAAASGSRRSLSEPRAISPSCAGRSAWSRPGRGRADCRPVVDVVLALASLLGLQRLAELALGLVLGSLLRTGFG